MVNVRAKWKPQMLSEDQREACHPTILQRVGFWEQVPLLLAVTHSSIGINGVICLLAVIEVSYFVPV